MNKLEPSVISDLVGQARERLEQELRAQAEQIQKLAEGVQFLSKQHHRLEQATREQLDSLATGQPTASGARISLEKLLSSVRNLITATDAEEVFQSLTEEAEQMGVRSAVFDVRGKAAWGFSAKGFGRAMTPRALRALVIPLNQQNPFRKVYEIGGHVDLTAHDLRRNQNIVNAFKPAQDSPILLLPIRSAGSVTAIFYCDPMDGGAVLPVDALKILTEFAGAQLDRLMALSGEMPARSGTVETEQEAEAPEPAEAAAPSEPVAEAQEVKPAPAAAEAPEAAEPPAETSVSMPAETAPAEVAESAPISQPEPEPVAAEPAAEVPIVAPATAPSGAPAPAAPDLGQLSEAEQKVHKDAKRFAKLLISEIELYNKAKVSDGRKSKELYRRLKSDIDRSRQTYEKRFGNTSAKQSDYFHQELVRILAEDDPSLLGPDYPGPSA